ncbi:hypothetical protein AB1L42_10005 [Thalassoglobus sp. JC818]
MQTRYTTLNEEVEADSLVPSLSMIATAWGLPVAATLKKLRRY